jgi:hypothetical protein
MALPRRFVDAPGLRDRYGDRLDRLAAFLDRVDPLADAAIAELSTLPHDERDRRVTAIAEQGPRATDLPALRALAEQAHHVPVWLDRDHAQAGGAAFLRSGLPGGLVLAFRSLILGYCSPAGNKPLAFSGRLEKDVPRRLIETSRFVHAVSMPGGLLPGGPGFVATLKVRVMHAQVRRLLLASGRWDPLWGAPINQYDMAGTILLFSSIVIEGLEKLGILFTPIEKDAFMHQWRYVGWLMGLEDELLPASLKDATDLWTMISSTQGSPDDDSRALAKALLESRPKKDPLSAKRSEQMRSFSYELSRYLIGDEAADLLRYPRSRWKVAPPMVSMLIARGDALRRALPFGNRLTFELGMRYWENVVGHNEDPVDFALPRMLGQKKPKTRAVA